MGNLVRNITKASDADYGVNFFDIAPPTSPIGVVSRTIGIVGDFPWGPVNTPTLCYSFDDVLAAICPKVFPTALSDNEAMKAFVGKVFPGPIYVCRINATSAVAMALSYTVTGGAFVGTATYKGIAGNDITATWAAATDADSTHRNLTIAIGTGYSVLYENVTLTSLLTLGDPYITWTATSSPSVLPAAAASATSTTSGSNGSAVAGDFVGSSSSNVGIRTFYGSNVDVDCLFVAECPSGLVATVNTGLVAYATGSGKSGMVVLCSVASQSASAAAAYGASYTDGGRSQVAGIWPRVKVTDTRLSTFPTITVDGNAFLAVAMETVDPWDSPEGVNSIDACAAITGLETADATDTAYAAIQAGGLCTFYIENTLGPIIRGAVTTTKTSGKTDIVRSLYRRYFQKNVAAMAIYYVGLALQVNLITRKLGSKVAPLVDSITAFCADEQAKEHINGYTVDPFGSNVQADIDAGNWTIATAIDTFAPLRKLVIQTQIGSTVVTSS